MLAACACVVYAFAAEVYHTQLAYNAAYTAAGAVSIARLAEQFALVPQPGDERPGLLSLLHRLNRHYIQALGEGASTSGSAEVSSSSSC